MLVLARALRAFFTPRGGMATSIVEKTLALGYPSCAPPSLRLVRLMFCLYLALIAAGLPSTS